jgi:mycothiol synthase
MTYGFLALAHQLTRMPIQRDLPPGFTCRELAVTDLPSRVSAHIDAFPGDAMAVCDYEALMLCDGYDGALDLVVVDETGEVAAFCTSWFDRANSTGLFEPVGTRRAYRRAGLARAVMSESLRRLRALGAASVVVRVSNQNVAAFAAYQNLGFTIASDTFGFEKPLVD